MPFEFKITRRVEFAETDMAGIMHFSNFFRFMETAEHGFLRSLGFSVVLDKTAPGLCLPRVHAECDYFTPLRFEDEVMVHLLVARKTRRTLGYEFRFYADAGQAPREVARGRLTVVCARRDPAGKLKAASLPPAVAGKIQVAPPQLLRPKAPPGNKRRVS
jgi:YbgC/YbaW family acyl-CoA thioester hydrolase